MGSLPTSPWRMIAIDVFWEPAQRCASSLRYFHGFPSQYVMINGKFDQPDDLPGRQMVEGKYTLAPLYHVKVSSWVYLCIYAMYTYIPKEMVHHGVFCQLNPDMVTSVGVVSGEKTPVITDRNPHLEVKTQN